MQLAMNFSEAQHSKPPYPLHNQPFLGAELYARRVVRDITSLTITVDLAQGSGFASLRSFVTFKSGNAATAETAVGTD